MNNEKRVSFSRIKKLINDDFKGFLDYRRMPQEQTAAMKLGSLFHLAILEPEKIQAVSRETARTVEKVKIKTMDDIFTVSTDEWEWIQAMKTGLEGLSAYRFWSKGAAMETMFTSHQSWGLEKDQEPIEWAAKVDMYQVYELGGKGHLVIIDLKSTKAESIDECYREIATQGYLFQAWIYAKMLGDALNVKEVSVVFLMCSKSNGMIYPIQIDFDSICPLIEPKMFRMCRQARFILDNPERFEGAVYSPYESLAKGDVEVSVMGAIDVPAWYARGLEGVENE